jgi:GNAT superfamily N-acetyltransferase
MSAVIDMEKYLVTTVVDFAPEYETQVMEIARAMQQESVLHRDIPMNEEKLLAQLRSAKTNPDVYFRVAVRKDEVVGVFLGVIIPLYFTDERIAKDLAMFVKPTRRGGYSFVLLLADWERWATSRGVKKKILGQSTGVDVEGTRRLYEKLGYKIVGVNAVKE